MEVFVPRVASYFMLVSHYLFIKNTRPACTTPNAHLLRLDDLGLRRVAASGTNDDKTRKTHRKESNGVPVSNGPSLVGLGRTAAGLTLCADKRFRQHHRHHFRARGRARACPAAVASDFVVELRLVLFGRPTAPAGTAVQRTPCAAIVAQFRQAPPV